MGFDFHRLQQASEESQLVSVHVVIGRHGQQLFLGHRFLYENNVHLSDWIAITDSSPTAEFFKHPSALYLRGAAV
ncbi:hypothetical protein D3C73_1469230 [compost metagenome]